VFEAPLENELVVFLWTLGGDHVVDLGYAVDPFDLATAELTW
jgi:hypothetical protein